MNPHFEVLFSLGSCKCVAVVHADPLTCCV